MKTKKESARDVAFKDIREEFKKTGRTFIRISLKRLRELQIIIEDDEI